MKKWWWIAPVLLLLIGVGVWLWAKPSPEGPTFSEATVQRADLQSRVSGSGTVVSGTNKPAKVDSAGAVDEIHVQAGEEVEEDDPILTTEEGETVHAPITGVISQLDVKEGDEVSAGQVVAHVSDPDSWEVAIQVDEQAIIQLKPGQAAEVKLGAIPDKILTGEVARTTSEGQVENGVSSFDVFIRLQGAHTIRKGMTAEVSVVLAQKDNALVVPLEAVQELGGESIVLVIKEGSEQPERRKVELGLHSDDMVEVTDGLEEGERVQLPQMAGGMSPMIRPGDGGGMRMPGRGDAIMIGPGGAGR